MKKLSLLHIGLGKVGKEVRRQITEQRPKLQRTLGIDFAYTRTFTSKSTSKEILNVIATAPLPFVVIDTTAAEDTLPFLKLALQRKGFVVLANKKPLSGKQRDFEELHALGGKRLFYECTVGAGLPVLQTIKMLIATGDEIIQIQGCLSGTLGFLFSQMNEGKLFSEVVREAKEQGLTEPDPRDDLSGVDVARKALILSRLLGKELELSDIQLTGLCPPSLQKLTIDAFLKKLPTLDTLYKEKQKKAHKEHKILRYVAVVTPQDCSVALQSVPIESDLGNLKGTDNLIVITTKRYKDNPLIIKGPGAGITVTAAGVFADVLLAAQQL